MKCFTFCTVFSCIHKVELRIDWEKVIFMVIENLTDVYTPRKGINGIICSACIKDIASYTKGLTVQPKIALLLPFLCITHLQNRIVATVGEIEPWSCLDENALWIFLPLCEFHVLCILQCACMVLPDY